MEWTTACPDWKERIKAGQSIIPPPLFPDQAEQAVQIFKQLKIVDAPGSPTFGEACDEWVFDLVASIFGAYDAREGSDTEGRRLITEWFILIPKKNSKSTIAAGIMMTALILNWRMSGEFTILAPTLEVAANSFAPSRDMVKHEPDLDDLLQVQTHIKTITHRGTSATLKVIAADANTAAGKKSVGTLVDEIWLFGKQANAENMLREAIGGLASRPEGFVIYLTTQSDEPPAGVFRQKLQYARDVRDGKIDDRRFVPVLYEFPDEMIAAKEHLKPENFGIVNPNLGYSVDEEFLKRELGKAQAGGEESLRGFLSKHLNVEIGLALRSDRWAGADFWERQGVLEKTLTLAQLVERSEVVTMGGDGGGLDDLLGQYALGRCKETRRWLGWAHAWAHPSVLERRKEIGPRLQDFARDGHLTLVDRIGQDVDQFAANVALVYEAGVLDRLGVDPSGLGGILDALEQAGVPEDKIIGISQGWKLTGAIKTAERKLAEGVWIHSGQPLMAWCVGNAKIEPRGNAVLITKQASGTGKIDPLMAALNAVELMSQNPEAFGSAYNDRGILMF
jgi:phage terminase large subunit-like protein